MFQTSSVSQPRKGEQTLVNEDELRKLFAKAKKERLISEPELKDVYDFCLPQRRFRQDLAESETAIDRQFVYDSTATLCVRNLNTNITRLLIPQSTPFAEIVINEDFPNATRLSASLGARLESANKRLHNHFGDSNFYMAVTECINDGIVGGTYAVMINDCPNEPLRYIPIPIDELFFLQDKTKARVDCVFRQHMMRGRQLSQQDGWTIPEDLKKLIKGSPAKPVKITERVIPNGAKFDYVVWYDRCKVLFQDRLELNPFIVSRYETITGQSWGTSPARAALPDIRSINQLVKDALIFGEFAANGLWQSDSDVFGDIEQLSAKLAPGMILPRDKNSQIVPIEFPGNYQLNFQLIDRTRDQIKNHMLSAPLPSDNQSDGLQYMKSTVFQGIQENFKSQLGEPAMKMEREFLKPLAQQTCARLFKRGELAVADLAQLKTMGITSQVASLRELFRVNTNAALSRLLKQQEATDSLQAYGQMIQAFGPQVVGLNTDPQKMCRDLAPSLGMAARFLRTPEEVQQIQAQQQQQAQAMAQQQAQAPAQGQAPARGQQAPAQHSNLDIQSLLTAFQGSQNQPQSQ